MIAIVGATGSLGGEVARRLLATGHRVVAVTRAPAKAAGLRASGAEVRVADLTDESSLRHARTSVIGASADHPTTFWRTKYASDISRPVGLDFTILRAAAFMETHAHELVGKAILSGKPAVILGRGEQPMNFVAARDVASFAVIALTDPAVRNTTIEIGGPDNCTRNEVAALYARVSGAHLTRDVRARAGRRGGSQRRAVDPPVVIAA